MKKVLILFISLFVLCGCTAHYNVSINGKNIKESLKLIEEDKSKFDEVDESGWTLRESFQSLLNKDEFSRQDYSVKSLNGDNILGVQYNKTMLLSELEGLSILNQCYNNYSITEEDDIITIDTGDEFTCFEYYDNLDNVKFTFTTNHEVISTNCDEQDGNSYIWDLTKNGNNRIMIAFSESNYPNYFKYFYIIIPVVLVIIIMLLIFYINSKKKKENNI